MYAIFNQEGNARNNKVNLTCDPTYSLRLYKQDILKTRKENMAVVKI